MIRPADIARLLMLGGIWGSSFLFIKVALEDFGPATIVAGRLVFGLIFILAVLGARGERLPRGRAIWKSLAVMAIVSNLIPFALITWGEESISSSLAAILNATTTLFTATIATVVLPGERLTRLRGAGILLGFIGVAVIVGVDFSGGSVAGQLAVIIASASYAVGFVYARRHLVGRPEGPVSLTAGQLIVSCVVALPPAGLDAAVTAPDPTFAGAMSVITLGMGATGLGLILYYRLVGDIGATSASFVTYLLPVVGVLLGAMVLDEELGLNTLAGGALVIIGIALAERARTPATSPVLPKSGG